MTVRKVRQRAAVFPRAAVAVAAFTMASAHGGAAWAQVFSYLQNGDAENEVGAANWATVVSPWAWGTTGSFTVVQYEIGGPNDLNVVDSASLPGYGGEFGYFAGGPGAAVSTATQWRVVPNHLVTNMQSWGVNLDLSAFLGGYMSQEDRVGMTVEFLDSQDRPISSVELAPVTAAERGYQTKLIERKATVPMPAYARSLRTTLRAERESGNYNDGYADNLYMGFTNLLDDAPVRAVWQGPSGTWGERAKWTGSGGWDPVNAGFDVVVPGGAAGGPARTLTLDTRHYVGALYVGTTTGGSASLEVTPGSSLTTAARREFMVGETGTGSLTAGAGAAVRSYGSAYVGAGIDGNGTMTFSGASFTAESLNLGYDGSGQIAMNSGSTLRLDLESYAGYGPSGNGTLELNGGSTGTAWRLTLGRQGQGTLRLTGGSTFRVGQILSAGSSATGKGDIVIKDAGTKLDLQGTVFVGGAGVGTMDVSGGSTIEGGTILVASSDDSSGRLTVSGTGTTIKNTRLSTQFGTAIIDVKQGAQADLTEVRLSARGSATMTVDGAGTRVGVAGLMAIGPSAGVGALVVRSQAKVTAGSATVGWADVPQASSLTVRTSGLVEITGELAVRPEAKVVVRQLGRLTAGSLVNDGLVDVDGGVVGLGTTPADLLAQLASGHAGGTWAGTTGITSTSARLDGQHATGVGYGSRDGKLLLAWTYYGDANLDGSVTAADYALFTFGGTSWSEGDFNYDGIADADDLSLMDYARGIQPGTIIIATVPEPGAAGAFGVMAGAWAVRRRGR